MATHSSVLAWRIPGMEAWWAAVYGVAQSRTQLKWLSSSSSNYKKKINKQKPQLNRVRSPELGIFLPWEDSGAQWEEERLLFIPGKNLASEKSWTPCVLWLSQILSSSIKAFSFPGQVESCISFTTVSIPQIEIFCRPFMNLIFYFWRNNWQPFFFFP